jgi:guanine deaminase
MILMENDRLHLLRALEIAEKGIDCGGGPFGALIAKEGKTISEAHNRVVLNSDPTAHAEVLAIREAALVLKSHNLAGCTLYASCEPCPMCLGAMYWAGITKVVYASGRTDAAEAGFSDELIYNEIALDPAERKVTFLRINDIGGDAVFRKWDKLENKIRY